MSQNVNSKIKNAQIEAVIIRADGTVEKLGVVSYWDRNPFKRLWFWCKQRVQKFIKLSFKE